MESEASTKEENKREESLKNDQQKLETENFLEKKSSNFERFEDIKKERTEGETGVDGEDVTKKPREKVVKDCVNPRTSESVALRENENKVLLKVVELLSTPALPETEEEQQTEIDMSRIGSKSKVPNKSISRPSLSYTNSKIPGELTGQPSIKTTKDDAKYRKSREQELLDRIAALENKAATAEGAKVHGSMEQAVGQRQEKAEENLSKEQSKDGKGVKSPDEIINYLKAQNEDLRGALAQMTAILRDKTALCVSQEKKIAALNNQVESLKEVVAITKDLLNIRNMEVQHISNDISAMESKIDCERQRHNQMLIKMDEAVKLNSELKKEYENQMKLFQHLRDSYEEKIRTMTQNGCNEENKESFSDQQNSNGNVKATQISGKTSRGPNYKINFHDT